MPPEVRPVDSNPEPRELYALLGEFMIEFELFCFYMRHGVQIMAEIAGQQGGHVVRALTTEMSAFSLLKAYHSTAMGMRELTQQEINILSKIFNRAEKLIEKRNKFIHGTWFVGAVDEDEPELSSAPGHQFRHTKRGVSEVSLVLSPKEFQPLIVECGTVASLISCAAFSFAPAVNFSKNFVLNRDDTISITATGIFIESE